MKRKRKARANQAKWRAVAPLAAAVEAVEVEIIERPTPQRMERGIWSIGDKRAPVIDLACDYIGKLYALRLIEYHHHEAARMFQDIVAAYMADLPLSGYRSCIDEGHGGYDAGDGNPEAARTYEAMKRKLGAVRFAYLRTETDKPADAPIKGLDTLKAALDAVVK